MRINITPALRFLLSATLLLSFHVSHSQTKDEVKEIIKDYDLNKIKQLQNKYFKQALKQKEEAIEWARRNNRPIFIKNQNGSVDELMRLTKDGFPLYYSVNNVNAAKATRTNFLNSGGGLGLSLDGQGMVARVWDGGKVRASHQEFGGRVNVIDEIAGPDGNNYHATHVTGTVLASGFDPAAKGMAPLATARTFNWNNDTNEALAEVQQGMLLSNHSYGVPIVVDGDFVPTWYIGSYSDEAREWDEVLYNSPYYLMVAAAGNNGFDENPEPSTINFDKLTGNKVSKNNLVVANALDANIDANGNLVNAVINNGSSEGPADDNRIKPDITGNGTEVYSTYEYSDDAYASISGTSMASPNVMGTLLLLQQHYKNLNHNFMKAATLKALACHTADNLGNPGPDATYGWGLLNAKKAAETINNNGLGSIITEEKLNQGQSYITTVTSDGIHPLQASIVWTDVPGEVNYELNSPVPALVNDLDIRITKSASTYYPWKLQSNAALNATNTSDNAVDNVERIDIPSAAGTYTITVTHKGTLVSGSQNFSLVVTGVKSDFTLIPTSPAATVCDMDSAVYNFNYVTTISEATNFTVTGLPTGANATLSMNSATASGALTMTISNLQNVPAGEYTIGLKATNSSETEIKYSVLKVYKNTFENIVLTAPLNTTEGLATTFPLDWEPSLNAISYRVQVATNNTFTNLVVNEVISETAYSVSNLNQSTVYFWRVLPSNICGEALTNNYFSFVTGVQNCNNVFTATVFDDAIIGDFAGSQAAVPVVVTGEMIVGNLSVNLNISHSYIQDITVYLEGPSEIGAPVIRLLQEPCGGNDDIIATVSDAGTNVVCGNNPGISGIVLPVDPLSSFNNLPADGLWTLYVVDNHDNDGGVINGFSLNFCNVQPAVLDVKEQEFSNVSVYPNPTKGIINIKFLESYTGQTTLNLYDIQGRKIVSKSTQSLDETLNIENLSEGVYMLSLENGNNKSVKKIILNK